MWNIRVINLSTISVTSNSTVQFRFEVGTDKCYGFLVWALDEIMIYNCESLSIADTNFDKTIKVYPNPTGGVVKIKTTTPIKTLEVYNIYGQLVASNTSQENIDLTGFSQGIYILKVTAIDSRSSMFKVLKEQ